MPILSESKGDQIRELYRSGLSAREIINKGYAKTTVFAAIGKGRAKRPSQLVLEDILTVQEEILRLVRKLAGEQGPLGH